ncbi:DUF502 domain-containing protein [Halobellus sp. H-GB7]|uniref:DUF502 domain-containing protein n=1 Tax=Halobellus sp. H-GB7 TaxID=3069756 RepID=UPI0027B42E06|nr:DUF502 domain-containing protein [Halobellus sp. H-GB7]MDQ2055185.1 DUF502 domain-containing protein [Halobellus sp. H-GB7]
MSDGRSGVPSMRRVRNSMYDVVREAFISGLAVVVPLVITIAVFLFLLNTVYGYVSLFSDAIAALPIVSLVPAALGISPQTLLEATVPVAVFGAVLGIGLVVNSSRYGQRAVEYFDYVMAQIPGVGSVYESFRRMSDVMLESDAENFREVKLVEFPHEEAYTLGFVTTETPEVLRTAADHEEMLTLFLPLAPNPVMGGHLVHLPESRVMDVEMTVEDGIQAIVTSGVAMTSPDDDGLSREALASLTDADLGDETTANRTETNGDASNARHDEHERLDPKHAETPADLARFRDGHNTRPRTDDEGEDR